jgi:hypothetical protein
MRGPMKSRTALAPIALTLALTFASVAIAKGFYLSRLTEDEMRSKISESPIMELAGDATLDPLPDGTVVEVYYRKFNPLNPPSPREHFAVAEPSEPAWKSRRIGKITLYRQDREDARALHDMQAAAVAMGGIALVNVEREPILRKGSLQIHTTDWTYDIMGYAWYADVVVKR